MNLIHVTWYETHELVDKNGKTWKFDVHPYYGAPSVLRKDGKDRKRQPGPKSPFWEAFTKWYDNHKKG